MTNLLGGTMEEFIDAIKKGNQSRVQELMNQDSSLAKVRTDTGVSALLLAIYYNEMNIAEMIAGQVGELNIFEAASLGKGDRVRFLVDRDPALVNAFSPDGFPVLGLACFFSHPDVAVLLVERGADVNLPSQNKARVAPLHSAAASRQVVIARLLLEHGASVNATQQGGFTPLHEAAQNGQVDMIKLLLEFEADPNQVCTDGRTPLDFAHEGGHLDAASLLVESGAC
jgi:uncharacterized protein